MASPTYAPALAARTADLVELGIAAAGSSTSAAARPSPGSTGRRKIFEAAGLNPPLKPTNEREFRTAARRPKYSALSNARMEALGIAPMPSLDNAIREYMAARTQTSTRINANESRMSKAERIPDLEAVHRGSAPGQFQHIASLLMPAEIRALPRRLGRTRRRVRRDLDNPPVVIHPDNIQRNAALVHPVGIVPLRRNARTACRDPWLTSRGTSCRASGRSPAAWSPRPRSCRSGR